MNNKILYLSNLFSASANSSGVMVTSSTACGSNAFIISCNLLSPEPDSVFVTLVDIADACCLLKPDAKIEMSWCGKRKDKARRRFCIWALI